MKQSETIILKETSYIVLGKLNQITVFQIGDSNLLVAIKSIYWVVMSIFKNKGLEEKISDCILCYKRSESIHETQTSCIS